MLRNVRTLCAVAVLGVIANGAVAQEKAAAGNDDYRQYGIFEKTAPRPQAVEPVPTTLPLELKPGERIALVGNTLFERSQFYGHFETFLQTKFSQHKLVVRNLTWSADEIDLQPRPANFADIEQHLLHEKIDVIFAAYGFNESFAGEAGLAAFRAKFSAFVERLKSKSFNGKSAPRVVIVSPIANENVPGVAAGDLNNARIKLYVDAMREIAKQQHVGFVDVFEPTLLSFPGSAWERKDGRLRLKSQSDSQARTEATQKAGTDARQSLDPLRSQAEPGNEYLTINGCHLNEQGDRVFAKALFTGTFGEEPSSVNEALRRAVIDKDRQFFRRYRPLNTFYYTGDRNKEYGYLDFLPAMRNFEIMVANRDQRLWDIAQGKSVPEKVDDSNVPALPAVNQGRGVNEWLPADEELKAFKVDPRFEVNLFAGEEQFPELANPIQMRWDARGRLWVSCSGTYPHVYPGHEPNDRLVVLEDTDGDGKADKSQIFAEGLHVPLSFEFGDGGVYVSEQPNLTFLKDNDGDGKADVHEVVLSGFGTEDSHHALHDFVWTPDGALLIRESIFHHSQIETPYGPVRQQNSGWFRYEPRSHRLTSFGTYPSTNPWGVTFDDWGNHVASHPIFAGAFHALDPKYPQQHPAPAGLRAYSGTCGQEFVDWPTFPSELQGHFIKVRYKPTNRVEIHKWVESDFGFDEQYVSDLIFSTNLSFIPVDINFGPRGELFICDWYNPVKGHAQYSLRDERRDRHSGRVWRVVAKADGVRGRVAPQLGAESRSDSATKIADASVEELLQLLKRPEYRVRYWAKRELRERVSSFDSVSPIRPSSPVRPITAKPTSQEITKTIDQWVSTLRKDDPRFRHHQVEALWAYATVGAMSSVAPELASGVQRPSAHVDSSVVRDAQRPLNHRGEPGGVDEAAIALLKELLACEEHHARAAAVRQLRYWHQSIPDSVALLRKAANDPNGLVRMEAAICASYIGTEPALEAMLDVLKHPRGGHLQYAINCSLGSQNLKRHWDGNSKYNIAALLKKSIRLAEIVEPKPNKQEQAFDDQPGLKLVKIGCQPERMLFTVKQFAVTTGQPVKLVFSNPDATDHNLVIVKPDALEEVGMAANEMAKDPKNANSDFVPPSKKSLILHASPMIGPTRKSQIHVFRFKAPTEPGVYPFVCTFPGHWIVMNGEMVVARDLKDVDAMLAARAPKIVKEWQISDFANLKLEPKKDDDSKLKGMQAFVKAKCHQCHAVAGHGVNLGPNLVESIKKLQGPKLLKQIIEPSSEINPQYQSWQFELSDGRLINGVIAKEDAESYQVLTNLLAPNAVTPVRKKDIDEKIASKVSAMPPGLLNILTKDEILNLLSFLESGGKVPGHEHHH